MKGRLILNSEIELIKQLKTISYPKWLIDFHRQNKVIQKYFSLSENEDKSEMGVEMQWMTIKEQLEEMTDFYPGKVAIKYEYFPIGKCLEGSGDPYFLKLNDRNIYLHRVPHDSIVENILDVNDIEFVCVIQDLLQKS